MNQDTAKVITSFLPLIILMIFFYFFLIKPQKKKEKEIQAMRGKKLVITFAVS